MYNLIRIPLAGLIYVIGVICGWKPIDKKIFETILKPKELLMIFSHTSSWDFVIGFCYMVLYPEAGKRMRILVKPQLFEGFCGIPRYVLNSLGYIPSTRIQDGRGGNVARIVDRLRSEKDGYMFAISPKGSREKRPYKNGWFYIGKELGVPVVVFGMDYEKREFRFYPVEADFSNKDVLEKECKKQLGQIVPLYPDQEADGITIRPHDPKQIAVSAISWRKIFLFGFAVAAVAMCFLS